MRVHRLIGTVLLMVVFWGNGCGDRATNPVGRELIGGSGRVVELSPLSLSSASSVFEGVSSLDQGQAGALLVGRMNGLLFRSLLRFRVPSADSLARAAGESSANGFEVNALRLILQSDPFLQRGGEGKLAVGRPEGAWNEASVFVDTLTATEIDLPVSSIPGIPGAFEVSTGDSSVVIDLTSPFMEQAIDTDALMAQIDLMLLPAETADFLVLLISKEGEPSGRPRLELTYSFGGGVHHRYESGAAEDTFWGAQDGGGPASDPDLLILASGIRYSSILRFNLPDNIPPGASVNSVQLETDVDRDHSLFDSFRFHVSRLDVRPEVGDTLFTKFNAWQFGPEQPSFVLNRALVQGWVSGDIPNHGMRLTPVDNDVILWVVLENPILKVTYSLPPDTR